MLFDETRPVKKPYSIWELRQVLDSIDERRKKLIWHRSEVAGGEYHWNSDEAKKEYYHLGKQRGKVLCLITASI